ncbi:lipocalin family protein [Sphingobacterium corticis]|uniref:Lipocalin family protein n=1 Tax=Sphingobacterium corticis TaxID=1812823 RepID=A0ABW5NKK4_9SPHI
MDKKQSLLALSAIAIGTAAYNILKPVKSNVAVVDDLDLDRYMGVWHEVARLDFFWEKDLTDVTATYTKLSNGKIQVINRGFDQKSKKWKQRIGKAKPLGDPKDGALKVSFFGPIYAGYNIVHIDEDYKYALIFGSNTDYMWILSRDVDVPENIKQKYVQYASRSGYATQKLVWTKHEQ